MLIYSGLKTQFDKDVLSGMIGAKIEHAFYSRGLTHNNDSEFASWENSLREMQQVLSAEDFYKSINGLAPGTYSFVIKQYDKKDDLLMETDHIEFHIKAPKPQFMGRENRI